MVSTKSRSRLGREPITPLKHACLNMPFAERVSDDALAVRHARRKPADAATGRM
ncbi:MAG: hypothetical protein IT521_07230 [Burkholderiales bacterium]|nr:hypothetical protein [Burkholderiales bacterium]